MDSGRQSERLKFAKYLKGCVECGETENLKRCGKCHIMQYCGRDHQVQHWGVHKGVCRETKLFRQEVNTQKQALMDHPEFRRCDPFVRHLGSFGRVPETIPYLRALLRLGAFAFTMCHHSAVQFYLDCCMELLRLSWTDFMEVRQVVPGLLLQLNKDQECYDFLKWYRTTSLSLTYDWNNGDDYHDIKNANVFEPVGYITNHKYCPIPFELAKLRPCPPRLTHAVCMTLLKTKLLTDLIKLRFQNGKIFKTFNPDLQRESTIVEGTPGEFRKSREKLCGSSIILGSDELMDGGDVNPKMNKLKAQVDALYDYVNKWNPHFWGFLMDLKLEHLHERSPRHEDGTPEEAHYTLQATVRAFVGSNRWVLAYLRMKHGEPSELDAFFAEYP